MEKTPLRAAESVAVQGQGRKGLPLVASLDYCYRFRPLIDRATFEQELEYTESEMITYFPKEISTQYRSYESTTKYVTVAFWIACFGFAGLCHKISPLKRLLGEGTWKMFSFKITALVVPFLAMDRIMPEAEKEQLNFLWNAMKQPYKRYKYTGDILQLNPLISLTGPPLLPPAS